MLVDVLVAATSSRRWARRSAEDRPLGMGEASGSNPDESMYIFLYFFWKFLCVGERLNCVFHDIGEYTLVYVGAYAGEYVGKYSA